MTRNKTGKNRTLKRREQRLRAAERKNNPNTLPIGNQNQARSPRRRPNLGQEAYTSTRNRARSSNHTDTSIGSFQPPKQNSITAQDRQRGEPSHFDVNHPLRSITNEPFGFPGPRDPRFAKIVWIPQPAPAFPAERSLEEALLEHPHVKFEGIDKDTLSVTAKAVLHVTDEAAMEWLYKWCPSPTLESVFEFFKRENHSSEVSPVERLDVPADAMNLRGIDTSVAKLYQNCRAVSISSSTIRPVDVVEIIDNCIIFCIIIKDEERLSLLRNVKEQVQWIPICLSCKLLDIQKQASKEISRNAQADLEISKKTEGAILDKAMHAYETHRAGFKAQLLEQLKILFDATAPADYQKPLNDTTNIVTN